MPSLLTAPLLAECLDRPAAAYIGVAPSTLAYWAMIHKYDDLLPYARHGRKALYRRADLDKFLAAQFQGSTSR
jgi:hypothetical protein